MSLTDALGARRPGRAVPDDDAAAWATCSPTRASSRTRSCSRRWRRSGRPGPAAGSGETLIQLGFVDERDIAVTLAEQLGLDTLDLSTLAIDPAVVRRLPQQLSERSGTVVVQQLTDGRYIIAMSDPTNVLALDDVRLTLGADVLPIVAIESQIRDQLRRAWGLSSGGGGLPRWSPTSARTSPRTSARAPASTTPPTVQLVNKILHEAVQLNASDIHVETQRDSLRVRFRIDGILRDVMTAPARRRRGPPRIKIVSGLDIAERRVPQDGRTQIVVTGARVDTRVSTLPSLHGEKAVIRILTRGDDVPGLDVLGFEPLPARGVPLAPCTCRRGWSSSPARPVRARPTRCTPASGRSSTPRRTS